MIDLEIRYSARNAEECDRLAVALGAFRRIEVEAHDRCGSSVEAVAAESILDVLGC